jgi:hypothetical protein
MWFAGTAQLTTLSNADSSSSSSIAAFNNSLFSMFFKIVPYLFAFYVAHGRDEPVN